MSNPIVQLSDSSKWSPVYSSTIYSNRTSPSYYIPIPAFELPVILSSPLIVLAAENVNAKPWWFLGAKIQQLFQTGIIPQSAAAKFIKLPVNRPQIYTLSTLAPQYTLKVEIPQWFDHMKISCWEYTGNIGDSTERIILDQTDLIRVDLLRIETKLNQP